MRTGIKSLRTSFNPNRSLEIFRAKSQIIADRAIVIASVYEHYMHLSFYFKTK